MCDILEPQLARCTFNSESKSAGAPVEGACVTAGAVGNTYPGHFVRTPGFGGDKEHAYSLPKDWPVAHLLCQLFNGAAVQSPPWGEQAACHSTGISTRRTRPATSAARAPTARAVMHRSRLHQRLRSISICAVVHTKPPWPGMCVDSEARLWHGAGQASPLISPQLMMHASTDGAYLATEDSERLSY